MFHQNICISCLPFLTFLLNLEFIQCYNMILFAWLGVAWTQTDQWTYEHTKPSGLVMFEDKYPDNLWDFECKHYIHYILLYLYVWVCVWIYAWTCVHTWTIHRFRQGITSIRTVQTRPCHGMGKMSQSSYFMQTVPKYKLCREHTRALTKHTPGHSHTLSHTLVHSRTLSHTLAHRTRLVCLAAHPSWVGLWSHIKQITTWETTRACEFTRTAENEDPCAEQVVPRKEREEG